MGNDKETFRSKINSLTVVSENEWPILYYLGGPLQAAQVCIENQLTNS